MSDRGVDIRLLRIPAVLEDDDGSFAEMVAVRNETEAAALGSFDLATDPAGLLMDYHDRWYDRRIWVARIGGRIVGRGFLEMPLEEGARTAVVEVEVHPDFRRRGIGRSLAGIAEASAAEAGRRTLQAWPIHGAGAPDGPRIPPPTGFGTVPGDDPGVTFQLRRGWRLEQVYRISRVDLREAAPLTADALRRGRVGAGDDYDTVVWAGATPDEWLEDLARLNSRMLTDAPMADLVVDPEDWTPERVRDLDERAARGGQLMLTAAARHRASGRLVGFTNVYLAADRTRPAEQGDTLVLAEHRGHRLGLLIKAALHHAVEEHSPETPAICTFNAEENRPMLAVNESLGFVPIGYQGVWQKRLPPAGSHAG